MEPEKDTAESLPDDTSKIEIACDPHCEQRQAEELFYREMRVKEFKSDLALRVMNLPNDTHTDEIKKLAADTLKSLFE